jgi:hypothetical protein
MSKGSQICVFCGESDRLRENSFRFTQSFTRRKVDNILNYIHKANKICEVYFINPYLRLDSNHRSRATICSGCYTHFLSDRMWMLKEKKSVQIYKIVNTRRRK